MLHIHEWGSLGFKHVEAQFRSNNLAARPKKMYLVGFNWKSKTYRMWDPAEPLKIANSADVPFQEKQTRDVVKPKKKYMARFICLTRKFNSLAP